MYGNKPWAEPKEPEAGLVEVTLVTVELKADFLKRSEHRLQVAVVVFLVRAIDNHIIQIILDPLEVFQHQGNELGECTWC